MCSYTKEKTRERFDISGRIRYQFAFDRTINVDQDLDFDQAVRAKAGIKYDINNSILSPLCSVELFYDPTRSQMTPGFSKVRAAAGFSFELDGPQRVSVKYQLDKRFYKPQAGLRHITSFSYTYKF